MYTIIVQKLWWGCELKPTAVYAYKLLTNFSIFLDEFIISLLCSGLLKHLFGFFFFVVLAVRAHIRNMPLLTTKRWQKKSKDNINQWLVIAYIEKPLKKALNYIQLINPMLIKISLPPKPIITSWDTKIMHWIIAVII